jgi:uncharacterized protein (DUF1697 family)
MDHLRSLFEELGFSSVETFIASGNVIFDSSSKSTRALEKKIETYLQETLGYAVATFIRSTSELAAIAGYKPFSDSELNAEGHTLYIGFMADSPTSTVRKNLPSLVTKVDDVHLDGREVYWLCRTKFGDSLISGALLAKTLGMPLTLRNVTTIKKLAAKYS